MIFLRFNGRDDNLGDKLIFTYLKAELNRHDEVYLFGKSPKDSVQKALRFREAFYLAVRYRLKGRRVLVFHPPGARFLPKDPKKPGLKELIKDRTILLAWSLIGVKLHVTGISIGEKFNSDHYKRFKTIGVRDKRSVELLSGIGKNVKLCPDMAFLKLPTLNEVLQTKVLVSLRKETPDNSYESTYEAELRSGLTSVLRAFIDRQWSIGFFANVIEDRDFNISLCSEISCSDAPIHYVESMPDDLDYEKYFAGVGAVVSNRLHVLLPAMSEGLLVIALISRSHQKIINLFSTFGFDRFIVYTDDSEDLIASKVNELLNQQFSVRKENYEELCTLKRDVENYISSVVS